MFQLLKNSLTDFKSSYKKHLAFEFIFMLFTSFIFVPIIAVIFNRILKMMGTNSLLNAEVYKIGLSYTGLFGMTVISLLMVIVLFIEFGVLTIIAQKRYFDKRILISDALITVVKNLPKLLGFGILHFMLILLLIMPFINLPISPALLDFNLPIFLTSMLYESQFSMTLYIVAFLLVVYFILRSIFTLHFILIEDSSIWQAMKCSFRMTKYNKSKLLFSLFLLNIMIFSIGFLFMSLISFIPSMFDTKMIGNIIENYLITFASYMTIIFSLLLLPMNIIILTRLFYQFDSNQKDRLTLHSHKILNELEKKVNRFFTARKAVLVSLLMVYLTGMFLVNYTVNDNVVYLDWNVSVAGHRGDIHSAPENSISSIKSAIEKGVDAVEIDVMITKDGVIVLNHDIDLRRMAGVPTNISDMTYEEVSQIDIGHLFSEEFIGERIPTLDQVLEIVKDEDVKLIIDIKPYGSREQLAENVVKIIEKHEMEDVCYIQSFDYTFLQEVRNRNSHIKIGQIMYIAAGNLAELDVDFYTVNQSMLSERFIKNARKQNRDVWVWTVNIERNMQEVLKYDIDGIITDYPEKVQSVLALKFNNDDLNE